MLVFNKFNEVNVAVTDFLEALAELGWKQSDFCRKAGVTKNTPSRWVKGLVPIPGWVGPFLGAMLSLKRLHDSYIVVD